MCAFSTSLTTTVFSQRSMWRFETVPHRTIPEGQQSSIFHRALIPPSDCLPTTRFLIRGAPKAILQMLVGFAMVVGVGVQLFHDRHLNLHAAQKGIFDVIGVGLAFAAALELAYTFSRTDPTRLSIPRSSPYLRLSSFN